MGYNLATTTEVFSPQNQHAWLSSAHGTDATDSITLDAAAFLTAFPTGEIPSGVEVSRQSNGLYRPRTAGDTLPGFLYMGVKVVTGVNSVGALLWHGEVIAAKVPLGVSAVIPVQATHAMIRIV